MEEFITKLVSKEELIELVEHPLIQALYDDAIRRFLSKASIRSVREPAKDSAEFESNLEHLIEDEEG